MKSLLLVAILLIGVTSLPAADCPPNQKDLIINTQEKYDNIYLKYPDCRDFTIIKYNGVFIGDPRTDRYGLLLIGMLAGILITLKLLFKYIKWFDPIND